MYLVYIRIYISIYICIYLYMRLRSVSPVLHRSQTLSFEVMESLRSGIARQLLDFVELHAEPHEAREGIRVSWGPEMAIRRILYQA